MKRDVFTLF